ncbi:MAG: SIS domain-containing protein [Candidatus Nitrosotenuis sp.]
MGGSGTIHDIIFAIPSKVNVHISVVKGYHIPNTANANTLVVATSVSGNTAETLTVLDSAKRSGCKIVAFSDGGKMMEYCTKNNIEYRRIPMYHSPRASFTSFLFSMLRVLQPVIPIKSADITESIDNLDLLQRSISSENLTETNPALSLADWITEMPMIYYPWGLLATAIRFKNSLQENAKMHAIAEDVIEACHNGAVAWEKQLNFKLILLRGQDDYIKTKERWEILKDFFKKSK